MHALSFGLVIDRSRNGRAFDLRCHACEIAELRDCAGNFRPTPDIKGFTLVQRFQLCQLVNIGFHQIRDLPQELAACHRRHRWPFACFKRCARCQNGRVDIGTVAACNLADHVTCSWVQSVKSLAGLAVYPLPADQ